MATTFERVKGIVIKKYSLEPERVTPESTLETLGLDSLDLIEMLFDVEDEFNIRIPQEGGPSLKATTLQEIVDSIDKMTAQEGPVAPAVGQ